MQKKIKVTIGLLFFTSFMIFSNGCGVVQQAQQLTNLINCDFRIANVQNIYLAGINIQNLQNIKSLNLTDAARIMVAVAGNSLPLTFQLNIEGRNPNSSPAGMNKLDWMLYIDNIQMTTGSINNRFTIPPNNGTTMIPIQISVNLKQVLQGKSLDAIANFAFNLAGAGNRPTRITAKIQPTIMIGQTALTYPGYITINTNFSGIH
jgi:LEA14-like dessication related protein